MTVDIALGTGPPRGVLRPDLDADTMGSVLGAYLGELVRSGVDEGFTDRCVDLMWVAMTGGARPSG